QAGFQVLKAYDGATALHTLRRERPNLVVLDLMLPDHDGWDITRLIHSDSALKGTPIIMLTARIEDHEKIVGLELGADDYMTKPFNPREVVARVRSVLRRTNGSADDSADQVLRYEALALDPYLRKVTLNDQLIELTRMEYDLLRTLLSSPGHVFTRSELIEASLSVDYEGLERSLDTHIKNLRKKIEPNPRQPEYIQTVYGVGYRLGQR
ncbi:MAG: response regulator transcription factor, partial [Chloroflexi bacterium]|nr:response regulator transcription factor [Chloroflexota bacterium]